MFSFGHGLSYTTFEMNGVTAATLEAGVVVSGTLRNVGTRPGVEVVQVFARAIGFVDRRLVGFAKLRVGAGESAEVEIPIDHDRLRWWNPASAEWTAATGDVELEIRGTFGTTVITVTLGPSDE
jgi:beta-glucosidase